MKLKVIMLALSSILIWSCAANLGSTSKVIKSTNNKNVEAIVGAHPLVTSSVSFYVNFEIVVFSEEIEKYPKTWEKFKEVIITWSNVLPVRFTVFVQEPVSINPEMWLNGYNSRPNIVEVRLTDAQDTPWNMPDEYLGAWISSRRVIVMDADRLENDLELCYSVALHEMGHMFGVPHVIGYSEAGNTGFIVLEQGINAEEYVMYPNVIDGKLQKDLSEIEIMIARNNLLNYWTNTNTIHSKCELLLENGK